MTAPELWPSARCRVTRGRLDTGLARAIVPVWLTLGVKCVLDGAMQLSASGASITSSEGFALRAQRSDETRLLIWAGTLLALAGIAFLRREIGCPVMAFNTVFLPYTGLCAGAATVQLILFAYSRRATRQSRLIPAAIGRFGVIADLAVPVSLLLLLHFLSPRGAVAASAAPAILFLPLVVLLSIMRLKPAVTLGTGLAAAVFHLTLSVRSLAMNDSPAGVYPLHLSYGLLLAVTGVAGALVASTVRGHVRAAVSESEARDAADRRAQMLGREMSIAADIQKGLLPTEPPKYAGFDVAGLNRPADLAGGDYYDWQILPDGRLLAVMADVAGHGIGPALVMAVCRAYARASLSIFSDPTAFMNRLNELLGPDMPAGRFITLAVAAVDSDGNVQLLSAGHGPTLLYRAADRSVQSFGGDGVPLGVLAGETYAPVTAFKLEPGDMLLMMTDGYFEWARPSDSEQFGVVRIERLLADSAGLPASGVIARLDAAARAFTEGAPQTDDTTALLIRRLPASA